MLYSSIGVPTCSIAPCSAPRCGWQRHRLDLVVGDVDHRGLELPCAGATVPPASARAAPSRSESGSSNRNTPGLRDGAADRHWRWPPTGLGFALEQVGDLVDLRGAIDRRLHLLGLVLASFRPKAMFSATVVCAGTARSSGRPSRCRARPAAPRSQFARRQFTAGDVFQPGDGAQQGGLAAARRADEHHELAVADLEVDIRNQSPASPKLLQRLEQVGAWSTAGGCAIKRREQRRR